MCQWSDKCCQSISCASLIGGGDKTLLSPLEMQKAVNATNMFHQQNAENNKFTRIEYIIDTNHLKKCWSGFKERWYFRWRAELNVLYSYFCQDLVSLVLGVVSFAKNAKWNMREARGTRGTLGVMHWHKSVLVVGAHTLVQQGLKFRKASQLARKPTTPKTQYVWI